MNSLEITEKLRSALGRSGYRSAIVSSAHARELRLRIENDLESGLIDDALYRQHAVYFDNMFAQDDSWARSIIAVVVPQPMLEVIFTVCGRRHSTVIPPSYEFGVDATVTALVEQGLVPYGYRVVRATLPQKLLAAHCGLGCYGKNNVVYVEGMGSYHRLLAFYSDLPAVTDAWQGPKVLGECTGCNACTHRCPTGAIDPERFRVHAEKCLSFFNESTEAFPSWIDESWHHCLVGCVRCQQCCPANKDVPPETKRFAEFTDEETALLLGGTAPGEMPESLIAKFKNTDLLDEPVALARNLRSLLAASG